MFRSLENENDVGSFEVRARRRSYQWDAGTADRTGESGSMDVRLTLRGEIDAKKKSSASLRAMNQWEALDRYESYCY
jgi:hypothetical protein